MTTKTNYFCNFFNTYIWHQPNWVFMEIIVFILAACIFVLYNKYTDLKKDNDSIKDTIDRYSQQNATIKEEIETLKQLVAAKTVATAPHISVIEEPLEPEISLVPEPVAIAIIEEIIPVADAIEEYEPAAFTSIETETFKIEESVIDFENYHEFTAEESTYTPEIAPIVEKEYVESAFSKFIKQAEKQFADNWTGILGTAIMVLGIGYLSIYTALKVSPLFRILILWLYAGILVGAYYFLQKKEKWVTTGLWLRSAGASLFLFGCYGASQIPALAFITNSVAAYGLIAVGIGLNLYIGYIIKKQTFLSLHVILSILILCVIPEKTVTTFILAAITATIGIALSYKEKWEFHLLVVISAFIIFDIWFNAQGAKLSATENIVAIIGIITVAASCLFMQYRSVYENTVFDRAAFITHLTNWLLFAVGLLLHATGSHFKTFVLFIGAILCFFIALKARKKKVYWLYHLDGMVSFILLALSIIMLNDWKVGIDIIACILYALILVCLFVLYKNKETLLYKIFFVINQFAAAGLLFFSILLISKSFEDAQVTSALATMIVLSIMALAVPVFSSIKKEFLSIDILDEKYSLSLNGILAIALCILVLFQTNAELLHNLFVIVLFFIAVSWCFLQNKFKNNTFDLGRMIFYCLSIGITVATINLQHKSNYDFAFAFGLLVVIAYNWQQKNWFNNDFIIRFMGIIGANAVLFILVYKYLGDHTILQVFSLAAIAVLNHEFLWINYKKKSLIAINETVLYLLYFLFTILASALFLYKTPALTNPEIALTCIGLSTIQIYVLFAKRLRNKSAETSPQWTNLNLFNSELLIFNVLVFGFTCLANDYISMYLAVFALIFCIAFQKLTEFKRFNIYSYLLLLGGIIMTVYLAAINYNATNKVLLYTTQAATVALSIVYYYLQFKNKDRKDQSITTSLPYLQNLWIVVLLFIQVQFSYLPALFMVLSLLNFGLISTNFIKVKYQLLYIVATLAIVVSLLYSFSNMNSFTAIDWSIQLGSVALGLVLALFMNKKETNDSLKNNYQIVLNIWLSIIMFSQLPHKWLPVFWAATAIMNLYLYHRQISKNKNISIIYYLLANLHLGFLSFNFFESKFLAIYLLIFALIASYIYLAYKWMEKFDLKNSLLIYPATLSIGCFLYLTFDKGILTFFWILEALGLLILGIALKEKYFRYVSLSLVGICVVRLMFFDLSNSDFLIRAFVLLGVGIVLLVMNSLFKKYKDRFD